MLQMPRCEDRKRLFVELREHVIKANDTEVCSLEWPGVQLECPKHLEKLFNVVGYRMMAERYGMGSSLSVDQMLMHSKTPLPAALLRMNLQEQQIAVHMGVVINEYLTDAVIAGNERQLWKLLQNLFRMALQSDLLKSELYLQLVKQSNGNPEARQVERLLRLLHMVVIAIPCPELPLSYASRICERGVPDYLFSTMTALKELLLKSTCTKNHFATREQLDWFCSQDFCSCLVHLPDGSSTEAIYPSQGLVSDVLNDTTQKYNPRSHHLFALFLEIVGNSCLLANHLSMSVATPQDLANGVDYKLVMKRIFKIDAELHDEESLHQLFLKSSSDYLQGWYPVQDALAIRLCALQTKARYPSTRLTNQGELSDRAVSCIPRKSLEALGKQDWIEGVKACLLELKGMSPVESMYQFLLAIQNLPYGHCAFIPTKTVQSCCEQLVVGADMWLGVNATGVHLFDAAPYQYQLGFLHRDIRAYAFSDTSLSLEVDLAGEHATLEFETDRGNDIFTAIKRHKENLERTTEAAVLEEIEPRVMDKDVVDAPLFQEGASDKSNTTDTESMKDREREDVDHVTNTTNVDCTAIGSSESRTRGLPYVHTSTFLLPHGDMDSETDTTATSEDVTLDVPPPAALKASQDLVQDQEGDGEASKSDAPEDVKNETSPSEERIENLQHRATELHVSPKEARASVLGCEEPRPKEDHGLEDQRPLVSESSSIPVNPHSVSIADSIDRQYSLERVISLAEGDLFAGRYIIGPERISGKAHILFAISKHSKDVVVLKFYTTQHAFEKSRRLHSLLGSEYVCKLLDDVDAHDEFPPCLVFEKGDDTLNQWLLKVKPSAIKLKSTLHEVVHASLRTIETRLPSRFFDAWSTSTLVDVDTAVEKGESSPLNYTPMYVSPEIIQAKEAGKSEIIPEASVDMWSFGIVAFEVLTGRRFYGPQATPAFVKECLCSKRALPTIACIDEPQARRLVENLLQLDPRLRWSATKAVNHASFKSADDTIQHERGIKKLTSKVDRAVRIMHITLDEILASNMMVSIVIEEFLDDDAHLPFHRRKVQEAMTMTDDNVDNPIYVLNVGKKYRLRISLKHKHRSDALAHLIRGIQVMPPDGVQTQLDMEWERTGADHDVVALLDLVQLKSLRAATVSPAYGSLEEKFVSLEVLIDVATDEKECILPLRGPVLCKMVPTDAKLQVMRFMRTATEKWQRAPQWIRDSARGAIILTRIAADILPFAATANPSMARRMLVTLRKLLVLDCGCK